MMTVERPMPHEPVSHEEPDPPPTHLGTDQARAGATPHVVRYVLAISLMLAIVAMMIAWLWGRG